MLENHSRVLKTRILTWFPKTNFSQKMA